MRKGLARQRLIAVFFAAAMLFNYPLLFLFDRPEYLLGLPTVHLYLFGSWVVVIGLVAWIMSVRH